MLLKFLPIVFVLLLASFVFYSPVNLKPIQNNSQSDYKLEDVLNASGNFDSNPAEAYFNNQQVNYPADQLAQAATEQNSATVLGTTNPQGEEKWIEIDLAKQQLTAWEGSKQIKQYLVSTGLYGRTPAGTFSIWYKTRSQLMAGGSRALRTYYYLPNVPHNMFFNGPYAIHGAYWHNNFGHPMSHGCVNEPLSEAAWIFDWAGPFLPPGVNTLKASADNPGTRVWVH